MVTCLGAVALRRLAGLLVREHLLRLAEERLRVDLVLLVAVGVRVLLVTHYTVHDLMYHRVHQVVHYIVASERSLCPASLSSDEW